MKRFWEVLLSAFLWGMSWLHFLIVVPVLIALAVVLDPRRHDYSAAASPFSPAQK